MFDKKYEDRLVAWKEFRDHLETCSDPLQQVIEFYKHTPRVSIMVDPYDQDTWLDPWQLLKHNQYCAFSTVLAQSYSLQLTKRFNQVPIKIHIDTDQERSQTHFLLHVQERVIGYDINRHVPLSELPKNLKPQKIYPMPALQ